MKKKMTTVAFNGTAEQLAKLDELIAKHKGEKGALMPVLQGAQGIYGYLPIEVQKHIALSMDVPLSEVYGVATFYAQFSLEPKGKYEIKCCDGTACHVRGSMPVLDAIKAKQEELQKQVYAVSEKLYKAAAEAQQQAAGGAEAPKDDNVYDADYTDVDDTNK